MPMDGFVRDLGPCVLLFDGQTYNTVGGATWSGEVVVKEIKRDDYGDVPVNKRTMGATSRVEANIVQPTWEQLEKVTPGGAVAGTMTTAFIVTNPVGMKLAGDSPKTLVVKPIIDGAPDTDEANWITFYNAAPRPVVEVPFNVDGQRVYHVVWDAFPNGSQKIYRIGPTPA